MNSATILKRKPRPPRIEAASHLFALGQIVKLRGGFAGQALTAEVYHVTGLLPPRGDSLQYRIRNSEERHERVTTQDTLEAVAESGAGETLLARTFGNDQGAASLVAGASER